MTLQIQNVSKSFGTFLALRDIDLDVGDTEFVCLLGPSGCGKTTLLRIVAGLLPFERGHILLGGEPLDATPARERNFGIVFQSYSLFPNMTALQNVGYGPRLRGLSRQAVRAQAERFLEMVKMPHLADRYPHELSGGQQQRVAIARALAAEPALLLLDEPLSALDKKLRDQMQVELRALQQSIGITFILVTHDQEEALIMSDRIAVMFEGEIAQLASPEELYRRPRTKRVASFIGVMNFLPASFVANDGTGVTVEIPALGRVTIRQDAVPDGLNPAAIDTIGIRPEMLTILSDDAEPAERTTPGTVTGTAYYGDMTYYTVQLAGGGDPVTISMRNTAGRSVLPAGSAVTVGWGAESVVLFE